MSTNCLLCGRATLVTLADVRDTRFGIEGRWSIRRCRRCGLEQTDPVPTLDELIDLYERHYNYAGERDTSYTRLRDWFLMSPFYQLMLKLDGDISFHAETGLGRLLDVGCNEGRGLILYARNGFAAEGLELNPAAAAAARERGFVVHEEEIESFEPKSPYDRVVLSNVLEHVLDPRAMLSQVRRILRPGGQVWISLPNNRSWLKRLFGRSWINWHVPFHITHFSQPCLRRLLIETGFVVLSERQATPALWVARSAIAWAFAGKAPGAARGLPRLQRDPLLVGVLMGLARFVLFPALWFGNLFGRGDCLVVKARRR